jgi:hypothetical protein
MQSYIKIYSVHTPWGIAYYFFLTSQHKERRELFTEIYLLIISHDPKIGIIHKNFRRIKHHSESLAALGLDDAGKTYEFKEEKRHAENMLASFYIEKNVFEIPPVQFKEVKYIKSIPDDALSDLATNTSSDALNKWVQKVRMFKR